MKNGAGVGSVPEATMTTGFTGWSSLSVSACSILWTMLLPSTTWQHTRERERWTHELGTGSVTKPRATGWRGGSSYLAEDRVFAVQPRCRDRGDEELAPVGVFAWGGLTGRLIIERCERQAWSKMWSSYAHTCWYRPYFLYYEAKLFPRKIHDSQISRISHLSSSKFKKHLHIFTFFSL